MFFFTVPEPIYRLSSLKRLNMSHNCISELSNLTGVCVKISVHLTYTKPPSDHKDRPKRCILNNFLSSLDTWTLMEVLNVSRNQLTTLPVRKDSSLSRLSVSGD